MNFDRDVVRGMVSNLSFSMQLFFSLLCAERLHGCCWAFGVKEHLDVSAYYDGCDAIFRYLVGDFLLDITNVTVLKATLEDKIPHSDTYGYPLAVQAQSGMLALLCCFDLFVNKECSEAVNASSLVVDALDNYDYFVHNKISKTKINPTEYSLLDREIQWQSECINLICSMSQLDMQSVLKLRILNRGYAVPIAV